MLKDFLITGTLIVIMVVLFAAAGALIGKFTDTEPDEEAIITAFSALMIFGLLFQMLDNVGALSDDTIGNVLLGMKWMYLVFGIPMVIAIIAAYIYKRKHPKG
jgi:hypothetical protein